MEVFISKGKWRDTDIFNMTFKMVSDDVMVGKNGFYVTVDGKPLNSNTKNIRIYLKNKQDAIISGRPEVIIHDENSITPSHNVPLDGDFENETEESTIKRINERFAILSELTEACVDGKIRGMIVSGQAGCGKSHTVSEKLALKSGWTVMQNDGLNYEVIHGNVSPIGLYKKLYEFRHPENVLVFDDSDAVFFDPISLGLLKTALDTSYKRTLSWNSESRVLKDEGIDSRFDFNGSVIFITNMDLENTRSKQLKPHFEALISRSHYLDLSIKTRRDKYLRIKDLVINGTMLERYCFSNDTKAQILDYVKDNIDSLRELSLRTIIKISDIIKIRPQSWKEVCNVTVLK